MAMADAGYKREQVRIDSAHLGVFVGISGSDWRDVCATPSANGVPETFIAPPGRPLAVKALLSFRYSLYGLL